MKHYRLLSCRIWMIVLSACCLFSACGDEDETGGGGGGVTPPAGNQIVTTGSASDVTYHSAMITNGINVDKVVGQDFSMSVYYWKDETDKHQVWTDDAIENGCYTISLSGLDAETTYFYQACVRLRGIDYKGEVKQFKTTAYSVPKPQAVDLGLSVKWASCNLGATKETEYGGYYAWGETTTKASYVASNSVTHNKSTSALRSQGIIDSNNNLTADYDAAAKSLGGSWRMPTSIELLELQFRCTWTWTLVSGVKGYKVVGLNGNYIFLPAAGCCDEEGLYDAGSYGNYWSGTANDFDSACDLFFYSSKVYFGNFDRYCGCPVRPVSV